MRRDKHTASTLLTGWRKRQYQVPGVESSLFQYLSKKKAPQIAGLPAYCLILGVQSTVTWTSIAFSSSALGRVISSTPSVNTAFTWSA